MCFCVSIFRFPGLVEKNDGRLASLNVDCWKSYSKSD
ncbi:hypothetical protein CAEBREN_21493 [Caenorhabditis brenneri]|uniref:Uncharacterized protein n=1 Tax=Caenorhabditis brenneri TaxID=135651 RepID=G0PF11_CAEBE|nr:hypothetical protein CAEBREN_21493 [Caenorhabditis brenneri]